MYGTTEIGVVLVNYPGARDYLVKPGSLGKAVEGYELKILPETAEGPGAAAHAESARKAGVLARVHQDEQHEDHGEPDLQDREDRFHVAKSIATFART